MHDSFWERRTTFWKDKEPSSGPAQAGDEAHCWKDEDASPEAEPAGDEANFWKEKEPGQRAGPAKIASSVSRRARRVRARSSKRLAAAVALASAACIVFVYGLLASDVSRAPDGGQAARAADDTPTDGYAGSPSSGPLVNAIPLASVKDAARDLATTPGAAPAAGATLSQAGVASGGGTGTSATNGTSVPSGSAASAPARAPAPATGGGSAPAAPSQPAPAPAPAPAPPSTTAPPPPPPPCTIGLLGTCIVGGGGLLP